MNANFRDPAIAAPLKQIHTYDLDFVTPPGVILEGKLEELGMSQAEVAERIGRTKKTVNEIIKAKAPLLPETAIQLERVLGIPARFWTNAEANYRQWVARQKEASRLAEQRESMKELPTAQLVKAGWLPKRSDSVTRLRNILQFFGVASLDALSQIREREAPCLSPIRRAQRESLCSSRMAPHRRDRGSKDSLCAL